MQSFWWIWVNPILLTLLVQIEKALLVLTVYFSCLTGYGDDRRRLRLSWKHFRSSQHVGKGSNDRKSPVHWVISETHFVLLLVYPFSSGPAMDEWFDSWLISFRLKLFIGDLWVWAINMFTSFHRQITSPKYFQCDGGYLHIFLPSLHIPEGCTILRGMCKNIHGKFGRMKSKTVFSALDKEHTEECNSFEWAFGLSSEAKKDCSLSWNTLLTTSGISPMVHSALGGIRSAPGFLVEIFLFFISPAFYPLASEVEVWFFWSCWMKLGNLWCVMSSDLREVGFWGQPWCLRCTAYV